MPEPRAAAVLRPVYPNPFNPQSSVRFSLTERASVRLAVYDVQGRLVRVLVDGPLAAGDHEVSFDARDLPSGVYINRLEVDGKVSTNRMILTK